MPVGETASDRKPRQFPPFEQSAGQVTPWVRQRTDERRAEAKTKRLLNGTQFVESLLRFVVRGVAMTNAVNACAKHCGQHFGAVRSHWVHPRCQHRIRFPSPDRMTENNGDFHQATAMIRLLPHVHPSTRISLLPIAAVLAGLLSLAGCATTQPAPDQALQAAEMAIGNAERDRASQFAAAELSEARTKLSAARDAVRNEEMVHAKRLAEQSQADAELASAKAGVVQATTVNDEMQKSIDILQQEMQRNKGAH